MLQTGLLRSILVPLDPSSKGFIGLSLSWDLLFLDSKDLGHPLDRLLVSHLDLHPR